LRCLTDKHSNYKGEEGEQTLLSKASMLVYVLKTSKTN